MSHLGRQVEQVVGEVGKEGFEQFFQLSQAVPLEGLQDGRVAAGRRCLARLGSGGGEAGVDLSRRVGGRVGKSQYHRAAGYSFQCDGPGVAVGVFAIDRDQPPPAPGLQRRLFTRPGLAQDAGGGQLQGAVGQWAEVADQSCTVFQFEFGGTLNGLHYGFGHWTSARWIILGRFV